ncbi:MAG: hypothetical protein WCG10_08510 [Chlamydiota bacterium]
MPKNFYPDQVLGYLTGKEDSLFGESLFNGKCDGLLAAIPLIIKNWTDEISPMEFNICRAGNKWLFENFEEQLRILKNEGYISISADRTVSVTDKLVDFYSRRVSEEVTD